MRYLAERDELGTIIIDMIYQSAQQKKKMRAAASPAGVRHRQSMIFWARCFGCAVLGMM